MIPTKKPPHAERPNYKTGDDRERMAQSIEGYKPILAFRSPRFLFARRHAYGFAG
ncbi:hypothetical protein WSS15_23870 [Acetobacter pasteurianus]|nr:hypothetical protein WSS15_23870 [Acetobacter pasteurianus]